MLWRALQHVEKGFYVDVGAWSPDTDSVTKAFYQRGWRGINLEPNPKLLEHYARLRPEDVNLPYALSDFAGEAVMYFTSNSGLSSLDKSVADRHAANGLEIECGTVKIETLANLLKHYGASRDIHFLKIDVEGCEKQVLAGGDWTSYRPWIVVVEATSPMSTQESFESWEHILQLGGYTIAYADGLNRFYVANEHAELIAAFKYPPNVFDQFVLASTFEAEARAASLHAHLESDRKEFLSQIECLGVRLAACDDDRRQRADQVEVLTRCLHESEKDRSARLEQIELLTRTLKEAEADRSARLRDVETLTNMLRECRLDRASGLDN